MTRTIVSVASALLALSSTVHGVNVTRFDAKADAQIHLYPFNTANCIGSPVGSPLEMKQGQCMELQGTQSLRPMFRAEHLDWINEVNGFHTECKLETFREHGCPDSGKTTEYRYKRSGAMPKDFGQCLVGRDDSSSSSSEDDDYVFYSAKFVCGKVEDPEHLCTSTIEHTSWSVDPTGTPHSSVHTATYTATLSVTTSSVTTSGKVARSVVVDTIKPTLELRSKPGDDSVGVWMLHPWSESMSCYLCYTKKPGSFGDFECRYGIGFPVQCGPEPDNEGGRPRTSRTTTTTTTTALSTTHETSTIPTTPSVATTTVMVRGTDTVTTTVMVVMSTSTPVVTRTTTSTSTKTTTARTRSLAQKHDTDTSSSDSDSEVPQLDVELSQKKSWHKPVKFFNPWTPNVEWCADAEWEKRGRPESYIKIQHCHKCNDKDRADSMWIGLPQTETQTLSKTTTTTSTIKHTLTARHDQL